MKLKIPKNIQEIVPYTPGHSLNDLEQQYGITDAIKLASNENPWGPSPKVFQAIEGAMMSLHRYPDGSSYDLVSAISKHFGVTPEEVVLGNGSSEIIDFLVKAFVSSGDEVITSQPSFLLYQKCVQVKGGSNRLIPLKEMRHDLREILATITSKTRIIFIDNPNNPTGSCVNPVELYSFFSNVPEHVIVVLDEAYVDFMKTDLQVDIYSLIRNCEGRCPVVSLRTFSKVYGLSGLRVGFALMPKEIADCLHKVRQPFNMNCIAQAAAEVALADTAHHGEIVARTRDSREKLIETLNTLGCTAYPSQTNFILVNVLGRADTLYGNMLKKGVLIRALRSYGFPTCIRVTVGTEQENLRLVSALSESLKELDYVS